MCDRRHQSYIDHTYIDLIKQRVFQIACGYEDANDSNDLRSDPGLKAACQRLPLTGDDLASQPTMSRLENSVSRTDLYRIGLALLETFIESYDQPPRKIILDIDDTDDATHGAQQLSLFHAYHDEYCYMPVHLYEGGTGKLITAILRPGRRIRGREAAAILKRVLDHILMAWPQVQITLRGDSHFSAPEVHDLCDAYDVDFILGQANNKKLKALGAPLMEQAAALAQQTEEPVRLFTSFDYQAGSWSRPRIARRALWLALLWEPDGIHKVARHVQDQSSRRAAASSPPFSCAAFAGAQSNGAGCPASWFARYPPGTRDDTSLPPRRLRGFVVRRYRFRGRRVLLSRPGLPPGRGSSFKIDEGHAAGRLWSHRSRELFTQADHPSRAAGWRSNPRPRLPAIEPPSVRS